MEHEDDSEATMMAKTQVWRSDGVLLHEQLVICHNGKSGVVFPDYIVDAGLLYSGYEIEFKAKAATKERP